MNTQTGADHRPGETFRFTFGASLFGALFGYAFLKPLSRSKSPIFGGYFGPKENCTVQTAATASGGLGILFSTGVPAMYQLGLLSPNPKGLSLFWGTFTGLTLLTYGLCL